MIIIMRRDAEKNNTTDLISKLAEKGLSVHRSTGESRTVLGIIGDIRSLDRRELELLPGVHEVIPVSKPYKLASREFHPEGTKISIGPLTIGNSQIAVFGGPCAVESEEMIHKVAREIQAVGGVGLRGGAFKPRTSPYSFSGLGEDGLRFLSEAASENNLVSISEVMEIAQIDVVAKYCDILQIGMRNMSNFNLLRALGTCGKPLLLKRGNAATYEEWLMAAEYLLAGGNFEVMLCERGIRTFENYTRNTMDIAAIPIVQKLSHLPIFADPSHGTGRRDKVPAMARAAVAAGANGLLVEVHPEPDNAVSDGPQSLTIEQFAAMMRELRIIASAIGKRLAGEV